MPGFDCAQVLRVKGFQSFYRDAVIRVCDQAGNVIEMHEHVGEVSSRDARIVCFTIVPTARTSGRPIKFETFKIGNTIETGKHFVVARY